MDRSAPASSAEPATSAPNVEQMAKVSDALTKGLTLLTAVLAVVASREGGVGRLLANARPWVVLALVLVLASVGAALLSWIGVARDSTSASARRWSVLAGLAVLFFVLAVLAVVAGEAAASPKLERPTLSVEQTEDGLSFTASIELLAADQYMTTEVVGYRARPGPAFPRDVLYSSVTGPDAKGRALVTSTVTADLEGYEVVYVYAYRGEGPPLCNPTESSLDEPSFRGAKARAGCAVLFVVPMRQGP